MEQEKLIIQGVTEEGKKLRPSDWIERICSSLAAYGMGGAAQCSTSVHPCIIDGEKCLVVARNLSSSFPDVYRFILDFAHSNQLKIVVDRRHGTRALRAE